MHGTKGEASRLIYRSNNQSPSDASKLSGGGAFRVDIMLKFWSLCLFLFAGTYSNKLWSDKARCSLCGLIPPNF